MASVRDRIDPELLQALNALSSRPVFDLRNIDAAREAVRAFAEQGASAAADDGTVTVSEIWTDPGEFAGSGIRLFRPVDGDGSLPIVLWFHGGGQVLGFAAQEDAALKRIAREVGCMVVAVEYRLAPEAYSPAAASDGYRTYRWLRSNAASLGADQNRIGMAGASGGGCIAAATALMIRDRGDPPPTFQALLYPMLDDRNETASSREIVDIGIWDRETNILAWQIVLGKNSKAADVSPYSAPARAGNLVGLPPAFVAVGELDVFRDEDLDYARRLTQSGVATELHLFPGAFHGWDLFAPQSRLAGALHRDWFAFMRRAFAREIAGDVDIKNG